MTENRKSEDRKSDDANMFNMVVKIAKFHRALYEAYVEQGFTDEQALFLVVQLVKSARRTSE